MSKFWDLECNQINAAEQALVGRKEKYLRTKGWEHSSSTPGSRWMWFKEVDGRHYGCGADDAFRIQKSIDSRDYASAHPEEFED